MINFAKKTLSFPKQEEEILKFWESNYIFHKLCRKNEKGTRWAFLDGPTSTSHSLDISQSWNKVAKDVFNRYQAMIGRNMRWQGTFNCHDLEFEVEKNLGLKSKTQIYDYCIADFSHRCRDRADQFISVINKQSNKLGQWLNWANGHYTMSRDNIETTWHFLKTCFDRGLLVQEIRVVPWCSRCGTALSRHEVINHYKQVQHRAAYFQFKLQNGKNNEYILVWTDRIWSIPANVAVAVAGDMEYCAVKWENDDKIYWIAKNRLTTLFNEQTAKEQNSNFTIVETAKGGDLASIKYTGPWDKYFPNYWSHRTEVINNHRIIISNYISTSEGTGFKHIAPGCDVNDYDLAKKQNLPIPVPVNENGSYEEEYGGLHRKNCHEIVLMQEIIGICQLDGHLYSKEVVNNNYAHCWRCNNEIIYRLSEEWFIKISPIRYKLKEIAKTIRWFPATSGELMQKWLDTVDDWCISRKRFWGTPLPIWLCDDCKKVTVIGQIAELRSLVTDNKKLDSTDFHLPWINEILINCPHCKIGRARRIEEIIDPWLDSGAVAFASLDYISAHRLDKKPFEIWQKDCRKWSWFPFDFVVESTNQINAWLYSTLLVSTVLENRSPLRTVITQEKVFNEKYKLDDIIEKYGADPLRYALCSAPFNQFLEFNSSIVEEAKKKINVLWNCYYFFIEHANIDKPILTSLNLKSLDPIDEWICARLQQTIGMCRTSFEDYKTTVGLKAIEEFVDDLFNWYIRVQKEVFIKNKDKKQTVYEVLYHCLRTTAILIAPILPFTAEALYQKLILPVYVSAPQSVHLCEYPTVDSSMVNNKILGDMALVHKIISLGKGIREEYGIKPKQPLRWASFTSSRETDKTVLFNMRSIIASQLNVLTCVPETEIASMWIDSTVVTKIENDLQIRLQTKLDDELLCLGISRLFIKGIQKLRKDIQQVILIYYVIPQDTAIAIAIKSNIKTILEKTNASELIPVPSSDPRIKELVKVNETFIQTGIIPKEEIPINPS